MTHTQGPWTIQYSTNDYEGNLIYANRVVAATITEEASEATPEDEANATLISASPAMLSALQALLREKALEGGDDPDDFGWVRSADADPAGTWQAAYQAIAKATAEHTGEAHDDKYYDKHCHPDSCDETCDNYPCALCEGCACCEVTA